MSDNPLVRSLTEMCQFLNVEGLDYVLVGGLSVGIWSEPRATVNVDFLISLAEKDSRRFVQRLQASDKFVFIHDQPMVFKRVSFLRATLKSNTDISVDFLFADDDFKQAALKRRISVQMSGATVNIPTPEDLILLKQLSGRPQDILDAEKIQHVRRNELDEDYMRKWSKKLGIEQKRKQ